MNEKTTQYRPFIPIFLALFIAVKLAGTSLATWSWWWLLMPLVPTVAFVLDKLGLLS